MKLALLDTMSSHIIVTLKCIIDNYTNFEPHSKLIFLAFMDNIPMIQYFSDDIFYRVIFPNFLAAEFPITCTSRSE